MEKEFSCGQTSQNTQEISSTTTLRAKESTSGLMEGCMKENGKITKCMVKGFSLGEMAGDTKANM